MVEYRHIFLNSDIFGRSGSSRNPEPNALNIFRVFGFGVSGLGFLGFRLWGLRFRV